MSREIIAVDKPWAKTIPFSFGVASDSPLLFTAGMTARDPNGKVVGVGDIRAQIEQCFSNLRDVLQAAGADYADVLKWTMFTTDIDAFSKHADVWQRCFVDKPASTLVEVRRLVIPEMLVEIEAVARLPKKEQK